MTAVRIGTCSWADESLVKVWYPAHVKSAEGRLKYYAELFDTVEVNSSYYALPTHEAAANWVRRTPDGFIFHVKAFGVMTRHPVKVEQLPPDMRDGVEVDQRGRVNHPSVEFRAEVFERFHSALEPLRSAGKLGGILMQMPPYFTFKPSAFEYLEWAQEQLGGDEMLVEFRHRSWHAEGNTAEVLSFLERRGATYVMVDEPRLDAYNIIPTVVAHTTPTAYLRLHGRNADTWQVKGRSAAERFDHLYSPDELAEWVGPLRELTQSCDNVYAMFNNNGRSVDINDMPIAQAPVNAEMLRAQLEAAGVETAGTAAQ